jgi:hypothetical protein
MPVQVDPNKLRAIELIVQGLSMEEVARQLRISSRTLRYWKYDKEFATELKKRFNHVRDEMDAAFNPILKRIQAMAHELLDGVGAFMRSSDAKLQERGMRLQLQLLKWSGHRENYARGADVGIDGMIGRYNNYPALENIVDLEPLLRILNSGNTEKSGNAMDRETAALHSELMAASHRRGNAEKSGSACATGGLSTSAACTESAATLRINPAPGAAPSSAASNGHVPAKPEASGKRAPPTLLSELIAASHRSGNAEKSGSACATGGLSTSAACTESAATSRINPAPEVAPLPIISNGPLPGKPEESGGRGTPEPHKLPEPLSHYPRTPEEFLAEARGLEKMAQEALDGGRTGHAIEIWRSAREMSILARAQPLPAQAEDAA